jgi:hypothetical protein
MAFSGRLLAAVPFRREPSCERRPWVCCGSFFCPFTKKVSSSTHADPQASLTQAVVFVFSFEKK